MLTAKANGTVTVYARSADLPSVMDSYEVEVKDSCTMVMNTAWSDLTVGRNSITGDLWLAVTDTQSNLTDRDCRLTFAVYSEDGQMLYAKSQSSVLSGRENEICFEGIDARGFNTTDTYYKVFLFDGADSWLPVAEACSRILR